MIKGKNNQRSQRITRVSVGLVVVIVLAGAGYLIAGPVTLILLPHYYRWFDGGGRESIGNYVVFVDYPWWIEGDQREGIALYRPREVEPEDVIAIRLIWDPQQRIDLAGSGDGESEEVVSGYTVFRAEGSSDADTRVVARRIRRDLVIMMTCADPPSTCIERMPTLEDAISIRERSKGQRSPGQVYLRSVESPGAVMLAAVPFRQSAPGPKVRK